MSCVSSRRWVARLTIIYRYTEDFMADLAKTAMDLWDDLEKDSGTSLRLMSGLLNFGDKDFGGDSPEGPSYSVETTLPIHRRPDN